MNEISDSLKERLDKMDFIEYLNFMNDRLKNISHRPKTDSAYYHCMELTTHIKQRIVKELRLNWDDFNFKIGRNLKQSADILDLYKFSNSDKQKAERIREFISEYKYDLSNFIRAAERRKDNPSSPIKEDEV